MGHSRFIWLAGRSTPPLLVCYEALPQMLSLNSMMLKNLMEDKQLNLDQPLLSVRRGPSTTLPDNGRKKTNNSLPYIPYLPHYKSELKSGPVRNAGAVPFQWEKIPGKPKDERNPQKKALAQPPIAPKFPPGRIVNHIRKPLDSASKDSCASKPQAEDDLLKSANFSFLNVTELERSRKDMEEENGSSTEDEDSIYVDALDTLSHSESIFLNCSVSGVSGLDSPDIKPSGTFSDPQTRDIMMGRFLPAAKAVVLELPHLSSWKQPAVKEQPRLVKKAVTWDMQSSRCHHIPDTSPQCTRDKKKEEEEEGNYGRTKNLSAKVCGLFPRFCLMNPISGVRDQARLPISSVCGVPKKLASTGSSSMSESKENRTAVYARRPKTPLGNSEVGDKANCLRKELNTLTYQSDSRKSNESSKYGCFVGNGIVPYRNSLPHLFLHKERGLIGIPEEAKVSGASKLHPHQEGYKKFQELLADQNSEEVSDHASSATEKTLHVDSVQVAESLNSSSSELKGKTNSSSRTPSADDLLQDVKHPCCIADEEALPQSGNLDNVDSSVLSPLEKSGQEIHKDRMKEFDQDRQDVDVQQSAKAGIKETAHDMSALFLLPPPLLKSPSESWLSRTLPSISSRNPSSRSHPSIHVHQGNPTSQTSPVDPKWEMIVKCSNSRHKHSRLPGELMLISENK
ncbi:hypothetical protein Nepgr_012933 [Nepenthes gracilis]|uniref:Uncharacterized protein n=1 Tax=Nepenthes gracilis TaxID=150966 RepID=A0AAD3SH09_NEPGR|nr:hypothetical protein Nepgr_012933 [Nepenthes gracilis]